VGIDPQSRNLILERLATLKDKTTMVYTTHYMREAELLCSYVVIMDAGEIIAEGAPEDLLRRDPSCTNLEELFIALHASEKNFSSSAGTVSAFSSYFSCPLCLLSL